MNDITADTQPSGSRQLHLRVPHSLRFLQRVRGKRAPQMRTNFTWLLPAHLLPLPFQRFLARVFFACQKSTARPVRLPYAVSFPRVVGFLRPPATSFEPPGSPATVPCPRPVPQTNLFLMRQSATVSAANKESSLDESRPAL